MDHILLVFGPLMRKIIILQLLVMLLAPAMRANCMPFVCEKHNCTVISPDKRTEIAANMRQARHYMEKGDYVSAKKNSRESLSWMKNTQRH